MVLNVQNPSILEHAKEAVKLFREMMDVGGAKHEKQLKLAELVLELVQLDLAEYAAEHDGNEYSVIKDEDDMDWDDMDWENLRKLSIWAVVDAVGISVTDRLISQFLSVSSREFSI